MQPAPDQAGLRTAENPPVRQEEFNASLDQLFGKDPAPPQETNFPRSVEDFKGVGRKVGQEIRRHHLCEDPSIRERTEALLQSGFHRREDIFGENEPSKSHPLSVMEESGSQEEEEASKEDPLSKEMRLVGNTSECEQLHYSPDKGIVITTLQREEVRFPIEFRFNEDQLAVCLASQGREEEEHAAVLVETGDQFVGLGTLSYLQRGEYQEMVGLVFRPRQRGAGHIHVFLRGQEEEAPTISTSDPEAFQQLEAIA